MTQVCLELGWSERASVASALRDHPVIRLRAPALAPEEMQELGASFGFPRAYSREDLFLQGNRFILRLESGGGDAKPKKVGGARLGWHSDLSYTPRPPDVTMLHARELPSTGGATELTSLYRLHDELDAATRERWSSLSVEHATPHESLARLHGRSAVHPLVRRHPASLRPLVFASPLYARRVLDRPEEESQAILGAVAAAIDRSPPDVVQRWGPHEVLLWDNRAVVHRATPHDPGQRRVLWRMSLDLDAPAAGEERHG